MPGISEPADCQQPYRVFVHRSSPWVAGSERSAERQGSMTAPPCSSSCLACCWIVTTHGPASFVREVLPGWLIFFHCEVCRSNIHKLLLVMPLRSSHW